METPKVQAPAETRERQTCHDHKKQNASARDRIHLDAGFDFIQRALHEQRINRIKGIGKKQEKHPQAKRAGIRFNIKPEGMFKESFIL
jgi:hypothetical protein